MASQVRLPSELAVDGQGAAPPPHPTWNGPERRWRRPGTSGDGLYVSKDGQVLRLTLGYPSGDPRLAAAARTIQQQLGLIGIEIDLLPDAAPALVQTRIATGTVDLALLSMPRGISDSVAAATAFGCPADTPTGLGSTVTSTTPAGTGPRSDSGTGGGTDPHRHHADRRPPATPSTSRPWRDPADADPNPPGPAICPATARCGRSSC